MDTAQAAVPADGEKLLAVLKVCQQLNSERDLEVLLALIAEEAARLVRSERASIFLLDRERGEFWSQVALGSDPIRFDARLGLAGAAIQSGEMIRVADAQRDPRFYPGIDQQTGFTTRSLLVCPMISHGGAVIGAFEVLNARSGEFTRDDEEILKALAAQSAVAIETAQLFGLLERNRAALSEENRRLRSQVEDRYSARRILGTSDRVQRMLTLIERVADTCVDVLVTGESGTGKELVARALHHGSARAGRSFVALNCAALPDALVESELFGIERGVATGVERKIGKLEEADGGTLFLDEIGDLSPLAQAKILRALQERVIERVGGRRRIPIDVRVIAASNKDLAAAMRSGDFREDLYYRLRVVQIDAPALREIPKDVPLLANHFLMRACAEAGREPKRISAEAMRALQHYAWPGNVRELENEMRRVAVVAPREAVETGDLSPEIARAAAGSPPAAQPEGGARTLKELVEAFETRLIADALRACRNNQQRAARHLGLSRQGLIKKMKRYGITRNELPG